MFLRPSGSVPLSSHTVSTWSQLCARFFSIRLWPPYIWYWFTPRKKSQTQTSNLQVPSLTQVIAHKLLESWGYEGLKIHAERVSEFYREKRDVFQAAMVKYLDGCAEWVRPEAGLFFWCVVGFSSACLLWLPWSEPLCSHLIVPLLPSLSLCLRSFIDKLIGLSSICPVVITSKLVTRNLPFEPLHLKRASLRFPVRCFYRMGTRQRMFVLLLVWVLRRMCMRDWRDWGWLLMRLGGCELLWGDWYEIFMNMYGLRDWLIEGWNSHVGYKYVLRWFSVTRYWRW